VQKVRPHVLFFDICTEILATTIAENEHTLLFSGRFSPLFRRQEKGLNTSYCHSRKQAYALDFWPVLASVSTSEEGTEYQQLPSSKTSVCARFLAGFRLRFDTRRRD